MKTAAELKELLNRIDHRSYPAYKDTRGAYRFPEYVMSIDHVQGDPFAAPSKVSVQVKGEKAGFPATLYDTPEKRVALQDQLLRQFAREVNAYSFQVKGSGKSGLLAVTRPGQEVLNRSGCQISAEDGSVVLKMEIGFPANGRTINARELIRIFYEFLPRCVKQTLYYGAWDGKRLLYAALLAQDQQYIRDHLEEKGLVAFVADGAILPRESGVSARPMADAVLFRTPDALRVTFCLPNRGEISGMGIAKGITLIVGGGYHGKSTLLKALEQGVYNHIAGDGREYVITDAGAMKLRAEDGRAIQQVDISMFITDLPNGKDTRRFSTQDASGSTSQAANVVEAMESGSRVFLIDEDTSATNFMIRDELMQRVVHKEVEPITPFIDRVRELYEVYGISTILVAGSSGSYFHKADTIVQMNRYVPMEITAFAKEQAAAFPLAEEALASAPEPCYDRVVLADRKFAADDRVKLKTSGTDSISINRDVIDLRYVEQLVDSEQLNALAHIIKYAKRHVLDGRRTIQEAVELLEKRLTEKGFAGVVEGSVPGNLAMPRKQEIAAVLNRYRQLSFRSKEPQSK